ncbi:MULTISPECIES: hypothetical protein [unclassified Nonomuraea]|nr:MULTISPECIES: hypothetical protein [unclassified Nonomuraea]
MTSLDAISGTGTPLTQAACMSDHVVVEHFRPAAVAAALAG